MFLTESEVTPQGILDALGGEDWLKLMLGDGTEIGELCPEEELEFKRGLYIISRNNNIVDYLTGANPCIRLFFMPAYRGDVKTPYYKGKAFYIRTYFSTYAPHLAMYSDESKKLFLNGNPFSQMFTSDTSVLTQIVEKAFDKVLTFS